MSGREERAARMKAYRGHEAEAVYRAELGPAACLWEDYVFLVRWGTSAELDRRGREMGELLAWWGRGEPLPADLKHVEALDAAQERLCDLFHAAESVEDRLLRRGWTFDTKTRTLLLLKLPDDEGRIARGPRQCLFTYGVERCDGLLVDQGHPEKNTKKLREVIRSRLAGIFHPDVLTDARIRSAVNTLRNPDRH